MALSIKEQIDFYPEFKDWYFKILKEFDFDYKKDCDARNYLSQILRKKSSRWNLEDVLFSFKSLIENKSIILIYGCGPSLEGSVEYILENTESGIFHNWLNLAADGASRLLREKDIPIDGIISDLDGITKREFTNAKFNFVHAHGDNIDQLKFFENEILEFENIIGTTQVEPINNLLNPGGFTDGDRIIYLLRSLLLPSQNIFFIGMDFRNIVGKYSKLHINKNHKASELKIKKLKYAKILIEWLLKRIENSTFFVNSDLKSKYFNSISLESFLNLTVK